MIRRATHAGSWYVADARELSGQLDAWLAGATPPDGDVTRNIDMPSEMNAASSTAAPTMRNTALATPPLTAHAHAIISPHAGYSYSGAVAGHAFATLRSATGIQRRVFILGPSHHVHVAGCALPLCTRYDTPLGELAVDEQMVAELRATGRFPTVMDRCMDEAEHSIEMQLPYVRKVFGKDILVVPVLVGALSPEDACEYGAIFRRYTSAENAFVISSDFCHWGARFNYQYVPPAATLDPIHSAIEMLDREAMDLIEDMDLAGFQAYLKRTGNTICGRYPILVLLHALSHLREDERTVRFVKYAQSSAVVHERESSVSYAAATVTLKTMLRKTEEGHRAE